MVHALHEAHRVLKPGGILIDLRPAPAHRQLGIGCGPGWELVSALHETLDEDHAADRAIRDVLREGSFESLARTEFTLDRVMDSLEEVSEFLAEFTARRDLEPHTGLVARLQRRLARAPGAHKFSVRGPMRLEVLRKVVSPAIHLP